MDRRNFTRILSGAATGAALVQSALPQAATSLPFRLSIMASTLGRGLKPDVLLAQISDAGYQGVELNGEYQDWSEAEIGRFNSQCRSLKITCDCIVDRPTPGGIVGAADPKAGEAFQRKVVDMLAVAKKLESPAIIIRAGARVLSVSRETQHDVCIDNMKRAGELAGKDGVVLLLENGDREENATSYLTSAAEGIEIVRRVGSPNVKMLYDFFHAQIEEGGLIKKLDKNNIDLIGTVHVADVPGRHEPGTGEINYPNIVRKLVEVKFNGWMAMEYRPTGDPVASLRTAREMVLQAANIR